MVKNIELSIIMVIGLLVTVCAQKKQPNTTAGLPIYHNDSRPGYYLQINSQNCYYDLRINDLNGGKYYDDFPVNSVRIPLNLRILQSGEQTLSLKIVPFKGEVLSQKAHVQMRLLRYADMTDVENEYGGSTVLWDWKMPEVGEQKLPFIQFDTIFKAEVPYKITFLDEEAMDLTKLDKDELLQEVVTEFTRIRTSIIDKTQDVKVLEKMLDRGILQTYGTEEFKQELVQDLINTGKGKAPQPLVNFELRLYYHGKVASLVKQDDKEPAIWFKHAETGARTWQPVYIYKNKRTGKWQRW